VESAARYATLFPRQESAPDSFWTSLRYFSLYRIVVACLFLGASLIYDQSLNLGSQNLALFRYTSFIYLLTGIALHVALRHIRDRFNVQLSMHVLLDIIAITLLMYSSGGVRSGLGVMLLISLTGASLVAPRRLNFLYASLATIGLLFEQGYWILAGDLPSETFLQPALLAIGCFAVVGATGALGQRVATNETLARQRGRELDTQLRVNQLVIEDMHDGVLVLDRAGRIVQHNPQAQRLLGIPALRGIEIAEAIPAIAGRWSELGSSADGRFTGVADLEVDGRGLRLRLIDTGTEEEFSVLFLEDTTRSRDQARQLKLAALGRLTANIAHEIRNPLSAISHASELLGEEQREQDRNRLCRIIGDNTRRLERLVADVLQLNRRDRIAADRVELGAWLAGFVQEFVANEGVPAARFAIAPSRPIWVEFDREHLRQVCWNLLRNAVRHSPAAPGSVRIALRSFAAQVELNIVDDGPGVPLKDQAQLFEPFFTTDSTGTGLGLYLARELCMANRARLEYVDDAPGAHFRLVCGELRPI
jgi:two-component system sensor histidine kinase PilS (NtrC family)